MFQLSRKLSQQVRSNLSAVLEASSHISNQSNNNSGGNNNNQQFYHHWTAMQNATNATVQKRFLRKCQRSYSKLNNQSARPVTISNDDKREFTDIFPTIVNELAECAKANDSLDAAEWFTKALHYNLPGGKKTRGLFTVLTYKALVKPNEITAENLKLTQYLGWCVEMVQCFFVMFDDIMDGSTTRRGQLCWHRLENVGNIAINDALMIENGIYELLRRNFRHLSCYVDLLELFQETILITTFGQSLDLLNANKTINDFSMERYNVVVRNKTSYYTFYFPVALGLHLGGIKDPQVFNEAKAILLDMGHFFQVQDDYLDCYGDPEVTGKIGTDIQDNKCSWLAVKCMERANAKQKAVMAECYGRKEAENVARIKQLYGELDIPGIYAQYEKDAYNTIKKRIEQSTHNIPKDILIQLLNKIYKRDS